MASDVPSASRRLTSPSMITNEMTEDLWTDIFKRMPIKTLCRLRSVCKSWNSHLSSPSFSTTYRLLNPAAKTRPFFRLRSSPPSYALHHQDNMLTYLELPVPSHQRSYCRAGSFCAIYGVVFFDYQSFRTLGVAWRSPDSIALWNPTIRKYVSAPLPRPSGYTFIGFGFDSLKNDFKVVWCPRVPSIRGRTMHYYKVFSVGDGAWRTKEFPDHVKSPFASTQVSCFFTGNIHWVTVDEQWSYRLLLFDCEREEFRTMDLAGLPESHVDGAPRVFVRGGLLSSVNFVSRGSVCEVWSMKEYGVTSTWTKDQVCIIEDRGPYLVAGSKDLENVDYEKLELDTSLIFCAYPFEESMYLMDTGKPCEHHFRSDQEIHNSILLC